MEMTESISIGILGKTELDNNHFDALCRDTILLPTTGIVTHYTYHKINQDLRFRRIEWA